MWSLTCQTKLKEIWEAEYKPWKIMKVCWGKSILNYQEGGGMSAGNGKITPKWCLEAGTKELNYSKNAYLCGKITLVLDHKSDSCLLYAMYTIQTFILLFGGKLFNGKLPDCKWFLGLKELHFHLLRIRGKFITPFSLVSPISKFGYVFKEGIYVIVSVPFYAKLPTSLKSASWKHTNRIYSVLDDV